MRVDQLEQKQNPHSPVFARDAEDLLRARRVDEALHLSLEGLRHFPDYATAHFVTARCFAQKNEFDRALQHLELAARFLPGNEIISHWMNEWRAKAKSPRGSADRRSAMEERADKPEKRPAAPERIIVSADAAEIPGSDQTLNNAPIVSVTLAEIYSMQGAYEAAIAMYRKLQQQKPGQSAQFELKIQELREKIRQRT